MPQIFKVPRNIRRPVEALITSVFSHAMVPRYAEIKSIPCSFADIHDACACSGNVFITEDVLEDLGMMGMLNNRHITVATDEVALPSPPAKPKPTDQVFNGPYVHTSGVIFLIEKHSKGEKTNFSVLRMNVDMVD